MEKHADQEEHKVIDFAFFKFMPHKYPVWADARTYHEDHANVVHNHDFPQLWYCLSGKYINRVEDTVFECTKGSVVIIPPGVFHQVGVPAGETAEVVHMNVMYDFYLDSPHEQYLNTIANLFLPPFEKELGVSFPKYVMLSQESQAVMEACMSWISVLKYMSPATEPSGQIRERLEALFSVPEFALPEQYRERAVWLTQTRLDPTLRVLSYLSVNYGKKIAEEDIVQISAICRANMYRYFKQFTGYTYSQYLQRLRSKYVYIYLKHTTYPLSYISDMCGFYDVSHMAKVYYKYTGVKPKAFRTEKQKWLEENPKFKIRMPL